MEVNTLDYKMGTIFSVFKLFIGPSLYGGFYPRPTNGVMVGDCFFLLIGSRKFLIIFCFMFSNIVFSSFFKFEGMVTAHCTSHEWCR